MTEVVSTSDTTVIVIDNEAVEQLSIVLAYFGENEWFPAALLELADALNVEITPKEGEGK